MVKKAKISTNEVQAGPANSSDTDEIKKVVAVLIQNFIKEEAGNRITSNNMLALSIGINQAIDGQITMSKPGEGVQA
jgi:hypothetical protein